MGLTLPDPEGTLTEGAGLGVGTDGVVRNSQPNVYMGSVAEHSRSLPLSSIDEEGVGRDSVVPSGPVVSGPATGVEDGSRSLEEEESSLEDGLVVSCADTARAATRAKRASERALNNMTN